MSAVFGCFGLGVLMAAHGVMQMRDELCLMVGCLEMLCGMVLAVLAGITIVAWALGYPVAAAGGR